MSPRFEWEASNGERSRCLNAMANVAVLEAAARETTELLLQNACFRRYAPGEVLYREGQPATAVFFLVDGVLRIFQTNARGVEYSPKIFRASCHLGDLPMLAGLPEYRSSVAALTPAIAAAVPAALVEERLRLDHALCFDWLRLMARKHAMTMDSDRQSVFGGLMARVANVLLSYADVFGQPGRRVITIDHPLSYQRLAEQVGCTRRGAINAMQTLVERGAAQTGSDGWAIEEQLLRESLTPGRLGVAYTDRRDPDES